MVVVKMTCLTHYRFFLQVFHLATQKMNFHATTLSNRLKRIQKNHLAVKEL